ncbi:MAG: DNA double-strand break repair nuclease NurA [Chloroflexi bacterium]|nr:DNA double-strand break repair nuclease NurA [Chloroflexota bacterium]
MPLDVAQLIPQLRQMSAQSTEMRQWRLQRATEMRRVFQPAFDVSVIDAAQAKIDRLQDVRWSAARFNAGERLNQFYEIGEEPKDYALISSDGSQIMPDRHKAVQYAAIQVASACIVYGQSGKTPDVERALKAAQHKHIRFLGEVELYDESTGDLISPGEISAERDLLEIEQLADQCQRFYSAGLRPIAVADGSLVPFSLLNEPFVRNNAPRATEQLERINRAFDRMRNCGAIVAGYIERPNSNTVARACALADIPAEVIDDDAQLRQHLRRLEQNMRGITDRTLLESILPANQRTALFQPSWLINAPAYLGRSGHTMVGCYLAIGPSAPLIARLEMPSWCAAPEQVGVLSRIMVRHTHMGGGYPLCLKAAHEEAVLAHSDEQAIDRIIQRNLIDQGIMARPSSKQEAKEKR